MSSAKGGGQTLSQKRAAFALERVQAIRGSDYAVEFRSYAANLPAMIQMNGFGQALAFCRSKSDPAYRALYDLVSEWLTRAGQPYEGKQDAEGNQDALAGITSEGMSAYRLAQTETLALLDWVKRFASAFIEKKVRNGGDQPGAEAAGAQ